MENKKIGIGIIGASEGGWAVSSHLPALQMLKQHFKVVAVSTTKQESADSTASKYGVPYAFNNEYELINHPEVDLVVITVKVPMHKHLVETAINAGKMIFCEWPLGNGTAEAEYLCRMATEKHVKTFCGLQSGTLPELRFIRDYITEGSLGEIFSATVMGAGNNWGTTLPSESFAYLVDPSNGATMLHIPFAHTLDGLQFCLGKLETLASMLMQRNREVLLKDSNKIIPQESKDQILVMGTLCNGTVITIHYHGGESGGTNLYWEIKGSKGELVISSPTGNLQFGKLRIQVAIGEEPLTDLAIPEKYRPAEGGAPGIDAKLSRGLYYAYQEIAADILGGTVNFPSFETAVKHHQLLDLLEQSSSQQNKLITNEV